MKFGRRLLSGLREAGKATLHGDMVVIRAPPAWRRAITANNDGCRVAGWEDHYIDYEALKGIVRAATADHADEDHVSELLELFATQLQVRQSSGSLRLCWDATQAAHSSSQRDVSLPQSPVDAQPPWLTIRSLP